MVQFKTPKQIFQEQEEKKNEVNELIERKKQERKPEIKKITKRLEFDELKSKAMETGDFWIGTKDKVKGQILYLTEEQKQKFVLVRIVRKIDEGGESFKYYFFNEPVPKGSFIHSTIEAEFYLYQLKTNQNTFQLFSTEKLELGEYDIWGTIIEALDYCNVGNYARIGKKQPLLFVHSAFKPTTQIQDHEEFKERFKKYNLTEKKLIDWLYTSPNGWIYEYPKSFSYIQIANLLACKDDFNPFHLPVLMIGKTGTGKTTGTELIFYKFNENFKWIKMTGSTLKGVVPSFANPTALKSGLFLEAKRYIPIDEFFQGISKLQGNEKEETMENLKDILDYEEGTYSSGHGRITGQMKAEHIALTNPKSYGNSILQLSKHFEPEILARYLIWYVPQSQKEFIDEKKGNIKRGEYSYIAKEDFIEGIDYLKTFNCDYDMEKVKEIYQIGVNFLNSKGSDFDRVRTFYTSRYFEHCCKLIDALIKFRCWVEGDSSFKASPGDYDLVKKLWLEMLEDWQMDFFIKEFKKI